MRTILLSWLLLSSPAFAGLGESFQVDVSPNPVLAGAAATVVVTPLAPLCSPLQEQLAPEDLGNNVLRLSLGGSDVCEGSFPEARQYALGPLARGHYTLRFVRCNGLPPPGQECLIVAERALTVLGVSQDTSSVPTLSGFIAASMAGLLALLGILAARRLR